MSLRFCVQHKANYNVIHVSMMAVARGPRLKQRLTDDERLKIWGQALECCLTTEVDSDNMSK